MATKSVGGLAEDPCPEEEEDDPRLDGSNVSYLAAMKVMSTSRRTAPPGFPPVTVICRELHWEGKTMEIWGV
jgi:hypothetical protein